MKVRFVSFLALLILLAIRCSTVQLRSSCTEGTAPFDDQIRTLFLSPTSFRGSGTVKMAFEGERRSAAVDVKSANGTVKASFYSAFGSPAGSVVTTSDSGVMIFQGERRAFSIDQTPDADLFPWAGNIRFGDLTTLLCGRLPSRFLFTRPPDERINGGGGKSTLVWKNDTVTLSLVFSRHSHRLKRSMLEMHPRGNAGLTVTCGSFFKGTARFISLDVDDRNYFSLKYEQLQEE